MCEIWRPIWTCGGHVPEHIIHFFMLAVHLGQCRTLVAPWGRARIPIAGVSPTFTKTRHLLMACFGSQKNYLP